MSIKFAGSRLSVDMSEVSRCILCHDPECSRACPQNAPVGDILRSLYFSNCLGAGSIQITTAVMQYGYRIIDDLLEGLSEYMKCKGIKEGQECIMK